MKPMIPLALITLAACAPPPGSIQPIPAPTGAYSATSCATARAERARLAGQLSDLEGQQSAAAAADAIGVFLVGIPAASLTGGNVAPEIGTIRGQINALDARLAGCR
jgi:hypothetical protein